MTARFDDLLATGTANFQRAENLLLKDGSVDNDAVAAGANLNADKLEHRNPFGTNFGLAIGGTVTDQEEIVLIAVADGTINEFKAKLNAAATTGTTSFDLKKNGSTVLSGTVDITSSEGTTAQSGSLSSTSFSAGDVFSISMSNSSGDGTGPFAYMLIDYDGS